MAWEQNTKARPRHYDVFARMGGGNPIRVNPGRSSAAMGGVDGQRLVYQQYRKGRSDLFFYDMGTGASSAAPKNVNSRQWEYWPSLSGPWLLYGRWSMARDVRRLYLQNLETGDWLQLDRTKGRKAFLGPGQVNGNYAVWSRCTKVCNVFRFDIAAGTKEPVANPGFYQRAPSVTAGGTVYFSRGGKGCGQSVSLVRDPIGGPQEVLVQLQDVLDIRDTYVYTQPNSSTEIFYERNGCGKAAASDIYKVREPALATLTVTLAGSGNGTVISSPGGINCGTDCSEDFETGTEVTLTAGAGTGSVFVGWGGACSGLGACEVTMDSAREVKATFMPLRSVTIVKDALPDDPQVFGFDPDASLSPDFTLDDDPTSPLSNTRVISGVSPDPYDVTELPADGWRLTNIDCIGDPDFIENLPLRQVTIDLDPDEAVVCTFQNTKEGSITILTDAVPDDEQDFSFNTTGPLSPNVFTQDDDADGTFLNQRTYTDLLLGTYTVTEGPDPPGWQLTDITCTGGGPNTTDAGRTATIGLDPGENVTCTFTNTKLGAISIVKDALPDDPQDFQFDPSGSPDPGPIFSLDDDSGDPTLSNQAVFQNILPGTYSVAEIVPAGWELTSLGCNDSDSTGDLPSETATIVVSPGELVTCTFVNTKQGAITIVKDALPDDPQDFDFDPSDNLAEPTSPWTTIRTLPC